MKNRFALAMLLLVVAVTGCVNRISDDDEQPQTINFSVGYAIESMDGISSKAASNVGSYAKELMFYDYVNGEKQQEQTFSSTDKDFGNVQVHLTNGTHRLVFIAHNSDIPSFSYPDLSFDKAKDTFYYSEDLIVDDHTQENQTISLARAIGKIIITATDAIPDDATGLRVTIKTFYPSFNISTGSASGTPSNETRTFSYTDSNKGVKNSTYTIYCFANDEKYHTDITIDVIGANDTILFTRELVDVPVKRNSQTKITGTIFSFVAWSNIVIQSEWDESINYPLS